MKHAWKKYSIVGLTLMCFVACSTQNTKWANVQYHNINTHYNVWWNGNESLKEGIEILNKQGKDDYTQILPVCKMGTKESAMSVYPQMDRAIEKGIKGIKQHSILVGGKEYVDYIKECYLMTAYATFYKHDFISTSNTCMLITNQFAGTRAADEAKILSARCMTMDKQYASAEAQLDEMLELKERDGVAKSQYGKLYMAMVECLIPQEKYGKAVKYIKLTLPLVKDNRTKARLNFIMAQIYQKVDKRTVATKYYEATLKCHPDYVMDFNARINIASCADLATSDLAKLEKSLDKMLNDKKNEEFLDQIYYAKGEMYMGMKDAKKACDNYKKSVATAKQNPAQKAKSSLRLAEVLYDLYENYDLAQTYYDTAMQVIKPDYPSYASIKERYDVLTSLVSYTRVISRNDSLFMVADMEPEDQLVYIEQKIEDLKKAEEEARKQAIIAQYAADAQSQQNTLKGNWYFYNANTVQKGKEQFKNTWGMRMLEDNWFMSNKGSMGMGLVAGLETEDEEVQNGEIGMDSVVNGADSTKQNVDKNDPTDPHNVAYYLVDLPKTEADRDSMNMQTADCLLNAGYMYYEGIRNITKSLECYLRMANDYTDYEGIVRAFYQLYVLYNKQGNTPQSNYYRDMVLMGFPDSDFANLIRDSEYYKELMRRDLRVELEYEELYNLYRRRRYGDVVSMVNQAMQDYKGNSMLPKFKYWKGLAEARMDHKDSAISVFEGLIKDNPATDSIVPLAQLQLDMLRANVAMSEDSEITEADEQRSKHQEGKQIAPKGSVSDEEEPLPPEAQMYRYRENMQHYVLIMIDDKKIRATDLQIKLANFNMEYYANAGFKVNVFMFTDTTQMLTIHRFNNAESAVSYWNHLKRPESPMNGYDPKYYKVIPMSIQNYSTFYNKKDLEAYMLFFNRYYMKK